MDRVEFLNGIYALATSTPLLAQGSPPPKSAAGITIPDSALAREATAAALAAEPVEIYNHSLRTFLFAELYARAKNIDHDPELVYVASILHDTGLTPTYMSERERFEVDGANAARKLLEHHGVAPARADLVWDAIALHDTSLAKWKAPEVLLVNAGVGVDFGAHLDMLKHDDVVAVLEAAPRAKFVEVFLSSTAAVAKKKPFATGNCFVTDVAYRMVPGFHLSNFCDDVKENPFAGYGSAGQD